MKKISLVVMALITLALVTSERSEAQRLRGQAVTYSNFDFIHHVATSLNYAYFATTTGITKFDKISMQWEQPLTGAEGMIGEYPNKIWVDKFDQKLIGLTGEDYWEFDFFFERWLPILELPRLDNDNRHIDPPDILLTTFDGNYMGNGRFIDINGRSFSTTDIVDDASGSYWMGTWGYGAAESGEASTLVKLLPYGLLQKRVDIIYPDDSLIWLSGDLTTDFRTGLSAYDPNENRFSYVETGINHSIPLLDITALASDSTRLYVGTESGLYSLERNDWIAHGPTTERHGLANNHILSLVKVGDSLYVGSIAGLNMINLKNDSTYYIRAEHFYDRIIYDLHQVEDDLWIASSDGAFRYSIKTGKLQRFDDPESILFGEVFKIDQFDHMIWFSSTAGIVRLNLDTGESEGYRDHFYHPGRALAVNDIVAAFASAGGITLYFWNQEKPLAREFNISDGLASDNVLSLLMDGDYVWIGSDQGLTKFWWNNPNRVD